ncbi:MAG: hypothetical protein ACTH32_06445 [Microbacterium gubbeenense]|uniref:hypothetical protein n=1 Tax=Microbacterium gubbeenense TaxID=159896 RepID=UPI003F95EF62
MTIGSRAGSVERAYGLYSRRETLSAEDRANAAIVLAHQRCWTIRQIAAILGVAPSTVTRAGVKEAGGVPGRFEPATLDMLVDLCTEADHGMVDEELERQIAYWGTGAAVMAHLTGWNEIDIRRRLRRKGASRGPAGGGDAA